jgi:hypothetical protein
MTAGALNNHRFSHSIGAGGCAITSRLIAAACGHLKQKKNSSEVPTRRHYPGIALPGVLTDHQTIPAWMTNADPKSHISSGGTGNIIAHCIKADKLSRVIQHHFVQAASAP